MYHYQNKTIIVTGGGQGIGRGLVQAFARAGGNVIIAEADEEAGRDCERLVKEENGEAFFIKTDVGSEGSVQEMLEMTRARYGAIDVLINNAGLSEFKPLEEIEVAEFDRVLAVNLRGAFMCSKYAAPDLKERKGVILNMCSTRHLMSEPGSEAYAASKGGIASLTHALAISLQHKVRVNAISPGWIEVRDWQKPSEKEEVNHREVDKEQHPVGRVGEPEDIAKAALYLCDNEASGFVTGQNFVIDGGMTVKMIYAH
ncbi:glucose 1-dehydrogenase [Roseivirga sp. BDSF3-8]|uniref:glucose 1-dehydrogenase n=1 Tax=Roseivirga sp. BDSF3-8 TaxID=3241598 RepID=UPI0035327A16